MRLPQRRHAVPGACGVALAGALAVLVFAMGSASSDGHGPNRGSAVITSRIASAAKPSKRSLLATERSAFHALRSTPEPLPTAVLKFTKSLPVQSQWGQAQRVGSARTVRRWLVPGARRMCLVEKGFDGRLGMTCVPTMVGLQHG